MVTLRDLRRLEDERIDGERRDAEQALAREAAERSARELAVRIAQVTAELEVERERLAAERERHAAERTRLAAELAHAQIAVPVAQPAPRPRTSRGPAIAAIALSLAGWIGTAVWLGGRLDDERRRADAAIGDLGERIDDAARTAPVATPTPTPTTPTPVAPVEATAPVAPSKPAPTAGPRPPRPKPTTTTAPERPSFDPKCKDKPLGCLKSR